MNDLVKRLRHAEDSHSCDDIGKLASEAADRIVQLETQLADEKRLHGLALEWQSSETVRAEKAEKQLEAVRSMEVPTGYSAKFTHGWGSCLQTVKAAIGEVKS